MTNEELERAVERLHELAKSASDGPWTYERCIRSGFEVWGRYAASIVSSDELARHGAISREDDAAFIAAANPATILALLSERAELLAAVERMRGALESAAKTLDHVDGALMDMADAGAVPAVGTWRFVTQAAKRARAALTTGEGK